MPSTESPFRAAAGRSCASRADSCEALAQTSDGFGQGLRELILQLKALGDNATRLERQWQQQQQRILPDKAVVVDDVLPIPATEQHYTKHLLKTNQASRLKDVQAPLSSCAVPREESNEHKGTPAAAVSAKELGEPLPKASLSEVAAPREDLDESKDRTEAATLVVELERPVVGTGRSEPERYDVTPFLMRGIWCDLDDDVVTGFSHSFHVVFITKNKGLIFDWNSLHTDSNVDAKDEGGHPCILHPNCLTRQYWNLFALALIAYDIIILPLGVFNLKGNSIVFVVEWICTISWSLDMVLSFRTGFYQGGQLVRDPSRIARNYVRTWFSMDLVIVILEWSARIESLLPDGSGVLRATRFTKAVRSLRLVRLVRAAKLHVLWDKIEEQVTSNLLYVLARVFKLTFILCTFVHVISCSWYAIGSRSQDGWDSYEFENTGLDRPKHFGFWYVASCRWTLAQINGRTDMDHRRNTLELVFACVVAIGFAIIFMALFISSITAAMMELKDLAGSKAVRQRLVNEFLTKKKVSSELMGSIRHHIQLRHKSEELDLQDKVFAILPDSVVQDLLYELETPIIISHPWFRIINRELPRTMRHICSNVVGQLYTRPNEIMFASADACTRLVFVFHGDALYLPSSDPPDETGIDEERQPHAKKFPLEKGMWLSEPALWIEWFNCGCLRSGSSCCMLAIEAAHFAKQLREYRNAYAFAVIYGRAFIKAIEAKGVLSDMTEDVSASVFE